MTEISHIVVNGCSFTYCQGLEDPSKDGWPALLAKKLGVPVVNLANGGSGNDSILRRTYEYFYKNKSYLAKPLYVIMFSHATRKEEFFKKYKGKDVNDFHGLDLGSSDIEFISTLGISDRSAVRRQLSSTVIEHHEIAHIMNLSYEACERKKFLAWNSCINLFKANNVPYITADYMPTFDENVEKYIIYNYKEIYFNCIEDENCIGHMPKHTDHLKKLSCGHEPLEAMPLISELLYNKITKLYGNIIPITHINDQPIKFLNLKEFYSKKTQELLAFNKWMQAT